MTVEEHDVVDIVAIMQDGDVLVVISDHLPWDVVNEHLWQLQEKLNRYLAFIESGEIYEKFPNAIGRRIVVSVALMNAAPEAAQWFFDKASAVVEGAGFGFKVEHRPTALH